MHLNTVCGVDPSLRGWSSQKNLMIWPRLVHRGVFCGWNATAFHSTGGGWETSEAGAIGKLVQVEYGACKFVNPDLEGGAMGAKSRFPEHLCHTAAAQDGCSTGLGKQVVADDGVICCRPWCAVVRGGYLMGHRAW